MPAEEKKFLTEVPNENESLFDTVKYYFDRVEEYFEFSEFDFHPTGENEYYADIKVRSKGSQTSWGIGYKLGDRPELGYVAIGTELPIRAPQKVRSAIAELIARINNRIAFGYFSVDMDDGFIGFNSDINLQDGVYTWSMFYAQLHHCISIPDEFINCIQSVVDCKSTPKEAFNAVMNINNSACNGLGIKRYLKRWQSWLSAQ